MNITTFYPETEEEFYQTATEDVVMSIKETLREYDECRIGLTGGKTPIKLYENLAKEKLPWDKIKLIQLDERQVPSDHPESNLRMLRQTLLNKISIPPENVITFDTSLPPESAAKDMARKIINESTRRFPIFDLLILGAGADGHIASLFEGQEAMECNLYASVAYAIGYPIEERLSVCLMALKSTRQALLLLKGEDKRPVVDALEGKNPDLKLTALSVIAEKAPIKVLAYF